MTGEQKPGGLSEAWRVLRKTFSDRFEDGYDHEIERMEAAVAVAEPAEARIRELVDQLSEWPQTMRFCEAQWAEERGFMIDRYTAAEAKLERAVEGFGVITDLSINLRRGGPDSSDLNDLSDALETAVSVAAEALAALQGNRG